ncbi:MAG: hypothetical protein M9891_12820 [Austwickia sp.]|nr:hypothetical protein [Actinomycetota bacterium]MCO5310142.1 hypothetical protein [Austwickia sp.]
MRRSPLLIAVVVALVLVAGAFLLNVPGHDAMAVGAIIAVGVVAVSQFDSRRRP